MLDWLHNRRIRSPEWMDLDHVDPRELEKSLIFIRRVNRYLGYTNSILAHLKRFSGSWKPGQHIRILDLATGSADIPLAILHWAAKAGFNVQVVAIDRHPITAAIAAHHAQDPRLRIVQADVFNLPFADGSFDYCLCAMFLHHLSEDQIVQVLRTMDRLAVRGIIAADLLRHRRAWLWINLLTLFSSRMIRHDAAVSIEQALSRSEILELSRRAGVNYAAFHRHLAHRFALAGEKQFLR